MPGNPVSAFVSFEVFVRPAIRRMLGVLRADTEAELGKLRDVPNIATRLGIFGAVCHAIAPKVTQVLLNTAFNMFPDSSAAADPNPRSSAAGGSRDTMERLG